MSADLDTLVALIDRFHITDRALARARERVRARADASGLAALADAAARYFSAMEHEAERQLHEIDRKLDDLYQRQYNLEAERGVSERRRDGAREVLAALRSVAEVEKR